MGGASKTRGRGAESHQRRDSGPNGRWEKSFSSLKLVAASERPKRAERLVVLLPPGRTRVSRCSAALSRWPIFDPSVPSASTVSTVGVCRGFLLGRPAKNEPHRIVAAATTSAVAAPRRRTRTGWAKNTTRSRGEREPWWPGPPPGMLSQHADYIERRAGLGSNARPADFGSTW